jgi:hypothetical protein
VKARAWLPKCESLRFVIFGLLALAALAMPLQAFSQNCALCYTQAASTGARMIQALKSGILILVIPPTLGSIGMIFIMRHKDTVVRQTNEADESGQDW